MRYLGATVPLALARVLREIERARNSLSAVAPHSVDAGVAAPRLTALLAYRDAVRQAPERPIGIANGWRILLLMVLPVLGWAAAALVERMQGSVFSLG